MQYRLSDNRYRSSETLMPRVPTLKPRIQVLAPAGRARLPAATVRTRGETWRHIRKAQLQREPLCRCCSAAGRVMLAVEVDHVRPLAEGGTDDPGNLQSLCHDCHVVKTRADIARLRGIR